MNILWRDSGKRVLFFIVDYRAAAGFVIVLIHISIITVVSSILLMVVFAALERFDYTLPNAARKLRVMISGRKKYAKNPMLMRKYRSS